LEEGTLKFLGGLRNFRLIWLFCFHSRLHWRFNFRCFDRYLCLGSWCDNRGCCWFRCDNWSFDRFLFFQIRRLGCRLLKERTIEFLGSRSTR
jgi:hypothetical protein